MMGARSHPRSHFACYILYVLDLPSEYVSAFNKALSWNPRIYSNNWEMDRSLAAVAAGIKPLTALYPRDGLNELVRRYDLKLREIRNFSGEVMDCLITLPEHEDIAILAENNYRATFYRDSASYFFIFGICLGYPFAEVESFCKRNGKKSKSLNVIKNTCEEYYRIAS